MNPPVESVRIDELIIANLRNVRWAKLAPSPRFNVISGNNGMGKTNLVEAVYLLGALRSFRTAVRRELIHHEEEEAKIAGVFGGVNAGVRVEMILQSRARSLRMDGKDVSTPGNHFQRFPMVLFHPLVMELVQGGPEVRRRFLDRALFQANGAYSSLYRGYQKSLAMRNHLLREGNPDRQYLKVFNLQLADTGSRMVALREAFVIAMTPFFLEAARRISGDDSGRAQMVYRPSVRGTPTEYAERLMQQEKVDRERRYTTAGPHADDIGFQLEDRPARKYASQGQQRTLVLAAKIAETQALSLHTRRIPLLLFDDVSSELDRDRNRYLFEFIQHLGGQVFITTTHPDYIDISQDRQDIIVRNGEFTVSG